MIIAILRSLSRMYTNKDSNIMPITPILNQSIQKLQRPRCINFPLILPRRIMVIEANNPVADRNSHSIQASSRNFGNIFFSYEGLSVVLESLVAD